ncbi:DUF362 domain-containing protein [Butyrivibrio proteoclasticus]|uniref:DUF362 domain-containing protein n=1 Tax=Butyrivibrio proteoclasticus TaxID=43305 RepID=UPI00047D3B94|nr:DUF362 domain-containing protein [Butyrivibrio proteoclasticus]
MAGSYVVIEKARELDYLKDFVVLPDSFGTDAYDNREDVIAIRACVDSALDTLDEKTHFSEKLNNNRPVIIKPNLVSVYHNSGFDKADYPETTDPRVFEAVVRYIRRFTNQITIAESSGKPMPTPASFRIAGYDRIARYYGTGLVALELRPVVRYMLPKAEVMKEIYIPDTLDEVVKGNAFYISVPKMKTNLYTGVTLGFKNAMGTIPYFLRERNHSYLINKKLADLLYLFKPDLTVIDGIIGGEGNTPAPVDPVRVGKIIAGNNSVEVDRITTRMMGFDPDQNKLMMEAKARGFGDPETVIIGEPEVIPFRPAISSFMDEKTAREFPNLLALAGHTKNSAPVITDKDTVTPEQALALEQACSGGCLAAAKTGLDYYNYKKSARQDFSLCIVEGEGVELEGMRWWFDKTGKPYSLQDIAALPMHRMALGNCAAAARPSCDYVAEGCCDPAKCMAVVCHAAGVTMPIMSPKNKGLVPTVTGMIGTILTRRRFIRSGEYVDCPHAQEDRIFPLPELDAEDAQKDYIPWPLPPMSKEEKKAQLRDQWKILLSVIGSGSRKF